MRVDEFGNGIGHLPRPAPHRGLAERARDWIVWFGLGRLVVVSVAVVAVGGGGYWLLRTPAAPVEAGLPLAGPASSSPAPASGSVPDPTTPSAGSGPPSEPVPPPSELLVHVAGAVARPGVYRLPPTARVVDAIAAAAGATADADTDAVNQAQALHDGDRVYVPFVDEATPVAVGVTPAVGGGDAGTGGAPGAPSPSAPIDLNEADAAQLDLLPGIGPATAAAIVAHREARGPFASVDDLADVRGIGPAKLDALRGLVTT